MSTVPTGGRGDVGGGDAWEKTTLSFAVRIMRRPWRVEA